MFGSRRKPGPRNDIKSSFCAASAQGAPHPWARSAINAEQPWSTTKNTNVCGPILTCASISQVMARGQKYAPSPQRTQHPEAQSSCVEGGSGRALWLQHCQAQPHREAGLLIHKALIRLGKHAASNYKRQASHREHHATTDAVGYNWLVQTIAAIPVLRKTSSILRSTWFQQGRRNLHNNPEHARHVIRTMLASQSKRNMQSCLREDGDEF